MLFARVEPFFTFRPGRVGRHPGAVGKYYPRSVSPHQPADAPALRAPLPLVVRHAKATLRGERAPGRHHHPRVPEAGQRVHAPVQRGYHPLHAPRRWSRACPSSKHSACSRCRTRSSCASPRWERVFGKAAAQHVHRPRALHHDGDHGAPAPGVRNGARCLLVQRLGALTG